ncbi:hypothetical protein B0H10DRAFT_1943089 [Mycena sp. CBHHK59/15]|nr:hypothetical protein B0H10DRAFT_1943089 [Mycena sp. CBHHK59/15]
MSQCLKNTEILEYRPKFTHVELNSIIWMVVVVLNKEDVVTNFQTYATSVDGYKQLPTLSPMSSFMASNGHEALLHHSLGMEWIADDPSSPGILYRLQKIPRQSQMSKGKKVGMEGDIVGGDRTWRWSHADGMQWDTILPIWTSVITNGKTPGVHQKWLAEINSVKTPKFASGGQTPWKSRGETGMAAYLNVSDNKQTVVEVWYESSTRKATREFTLAKLRCGCGRHPTALLPTGPDDDRQPQCESRMQCPTLK